MWGDVLSKKEFYDKFALWNKNKDLIIEKEAEYKKNLAGIYSKYLEDAKMDFRKYSKENDLLIVERQNFIEAKLEVVPLNYRISFDTPKIDRFYLFHFAITEGNRREFNIYIRPNIDDLYLPSLLSSTFRPKPKNNDEVKEEIKKLDKEFIFLDEQIIKLDNITCLFSFTNHSNAIPSINELKTYFSFYQILKELTI